MLNGNCLIIPHKPKLIIMIQSKCDYLRYIRQDAIALGEYTQGAKSYVRNLLYPHPIWKFQQIMRKLEYISNVKGGGVRFYWYKWRYHKLSLRLGFSIPINTFGPGLSIAHYGPIIINPACKIGQNCRIHACVNIGASSGSILAPKIGNNVYIGPSAVLFGEITIADNVTIGANATVNRDCMVENVVLAGTPATIVKENQPIWWILNKIHLENK